MDISCTICGSDNNTVPADKTINRYDCKSCRHSFTLLDPSGRVSYSEDYYTSKHSNWFNNPDIWLFDYIHKKARRFLGEGNINVIDVGCGKGDFLNFIKGKDPEIEAYGIDLSDNNSPGITFYKADFLKTDINRRFDLVTSMASVEHVDDVNTFIRKISEITSPGGIISITTDNTGGVFFAISRLLKKMGLSDPYYSLYEPAHLQHFTNKSLRTLLNRNGLKVILQKNHNYPIKAVDMPRVNPIMKSIYLFGIRVLFSLPSSFGILQTVICRKGGS